MNRMWYRIFTRNSHLNLHYACMCQSVHTHTHTLPINVYAVHIKVNIISMPRTFSYFPHQKTCWCTVMKANQKLNDGSPLHFISIEFGFEVLDAFEVNHLSLWLCTSKLVENSEWKKRHKTIYAQRRNCCTELCSLYNQNDKKRQLVMYTIEEEKKQFIMKSKKNICALRTRTYEMCSFYEQNWIIENCTWNKQFRNNYVYTVHIHSKNFKCSERKAEAAATTTTRFDGFDRIYDSLF